MSWIQKLLCLCEHDWNTYDKGKIMRDNYHQWTGKFLGPIVVGSFEEQKCMKCKKIRVVKAR